MLATYMQCTRNNNLEIKIVGSSSPANTLYKLNLSEIQSYENNKN